jgi:uncharacterized RDD family membrane protein YckC
VAEARPRGVRRLVGSVINPVVGAVDLDAVLEQVDVNEALERIDINHLLDRIDVDALLSRLDVNALIERIDMDAVLKRIDLEEIVRRTDVGSVVASSAGSIATTGIGAVRTRLARLDEWITHGVRRVFRLSAIPRTDREHAALQGTPAGPISRLLGYAMDTVVIAFAFTLSVTVATYIVSLITRSEFKPVDDGGAWWGLIAAAFGWLYLTASIALCGQTVGKAVVGVKVIARDAAAVGVGAAAIRAALLPVSLVLGLGCIGIVIGERRRALHDVAARTTVVHA